MLKEVGNLMTDVLTDNLNHNRGQEKENTPKNLIVNSQHLEDNKNVQNVGSIKKVMSVRTFVAMDRQ